MREVYKNNNHKFDYKSELSGIANCSFEFFLLQI